MSQLYDRADIYDLIESDQRTDTIRKDWKEFLGRREICKMLDVSIGTGGMTLPLQELGIEISGSDLSEAMLARCKMKAAAKGNPVELKCCDFRDLSCWKGREFDCVVSTGNALGYVNNSDVLLTLEKMDSLVKPGGFLCFDSRNWEMIQREKQRFYFYRPFFRDGNRVNLVQVWDHNADGSITFNLLYSFEKDNNIFQREIFEEHYHPFGINLVLDKMKKMGYTDIDIKPLPISMEEKDFDKIDWYRVIGKKAE